MNLKTAIKNAQRTVSELTEQEMLRHKPGAEQFELSRELKPGHALVIRASDTDAASEGFEQVPLKVIHNHTSQKTILLMLAAGLIAGALLGFKLLRTTVKVS